MKFFIGFCFNAFPLFNLVVCRSIPFHLQVYCGCMGVSRKFFTGPVARDAMRCDELKKSEVTYVYEE